MNILLRNLQLSVISDLGTISTIHTLAKYRVMQYTMIEVEDCKDSIACYLRATIFKQTDQKE